LAKEAAAERTPDLKKAPKKKAAITHRGFFES
jgi:hypothetical protein